MKVQTKMPTDKTIEGGISLLLSDGYEFILKSLPFVASAKEGPH